MTRIGPHNPGQAGAGGPPNGSNAFDPGRELARERRQHEDGLGSGIGHQLGQDHHGALRDGASRHGTPPHSQGAFEESLRRALGESGQEAERDRAGARDRDTDDEATDVDPGQLRLLAQAERPSGFALMPQPAAPAPASGEAAARVEALAVRIEQAMRAEMALAPGQPIALRLDLGDMVPGLSSLTVAMTADGIDVTLTRSTGPASEELLRAAQMLAERLQACFARRQVRVLDVRVLDAPAVPREPSGDVA
jgi:hypothetical protein